MKKMSRLLSLTLCVAMLISMTATYAYAANSTATFTDVPTTHWANSYIEYWASKGIVTGIGNQKFNPDGLVTYAQFSVMVMKAFFPNAVIAEGGAWYEPYMNAARTARLFYRTNVSATNKYAEQPVSRYETASIVDNVLTSQDITIRTAQRTQAMQAVTDFKKIPVEYQGAVVDCYALGIISGYNNGDFGGDNTLTRAQACVIMSNLENVVQNGNVNPMDGILANGKPITEANVLELLAEVEKQYPDGILWYEDSTDPNNNYNPNKISETINRTLLEGYNISTKYACGGFAAMVSDLVFGYDGNPTRHVEDVNQIRPGDIIIEMSKSPQKAKHVMIAMGHVFHAPNNNDYIGVDIADGNDNNKVCWPDNEFGNSIWLSTPKSANSNRYYIIYTRYPD